MLLKCDQILLIFEIQRSLCCKEVSRLRHEVNIHDRVDLIIFTVIELINTLNLIFEYADAVLILIDL